MVQLNNETEYGVNNNDYCLFTVRLSIEILRVFMTLIMNKSRLRWACRRGMLELDVLLRPFVDEAYDQLSEKQQAIFVRLLECEDPDLFAWFMGHKVCEVPELNDMVQLILDRVKV